MLNKLRLRLRALFFKSKMEDELQAELQFHLEREIEENIIRGMTPEEARCAAIRSFGGVERVKEESRDVRGIRLLEELWQDLRFGARMLLKSKGFTTAAALSLALGIGANTALFSLIDAILLKPLPVKQPEQLVVVGTDAFQQPGKVSSSFSYPVFRDLREQNSVFSGMFAHDALPMGLSGGGQTERVLCELVSGNFFSVLGVNPHLGRVFTEADDQTPGAHPVAVISYNF